MFDTPLRSAALGLLAVSAATLIVSQSSRIAGRLDRDRTAASRRLLQQRFRGYTLGLVGLATALIFTSELLQ